ncbi:MAG: glycosyltransferase [Mucinivorans sp.]
MQPLISVIVMTYNQELTVGRTLDSILAQKTKYSYEIIIGEDASPSDRTRAVCESYVNQYPDRIHLLPKAPNKGVLNNYIDCLAQCKGKYIAGCAGDDWWSNENKIELQVDFLEAHDDYGVVHTDMDMLLIESGRIVHSNGKRRPPVGQIHNELYKACSIYAPTTMYRSDLLQYIDFAQFTYLGFAMEDYPMWLEMSRHTKFYYINTSTVTYRISNTSASHSDNINSRLKFLNEATKIQNYFYNKYLPILDEPLKVSQHRMYYMDCLNYGAYTLSFKYINGMNFPWFVSIILHTYLGGWLCAKYIRSKYYKR